MNLCSVIRRGRRLAVCLALLGAPAAVAATPAPAATSLSAILDELSQLPRGSEASPTPPARVIAPVVSPTIAEPAGAVRGTMIMVHGGGWAGHSEVGRDVLMRTPGDLLLKRGWRVISIDYEEGTAGLQDVLNAAGSELKDRSDSPLCIYGESAGAHLALVAASRLRAIDCVVGLGTPTDLALYVSEGSVSPDFRVRLVAGQISRFFGTTTDVMAPWDPVTLAPAIHADALLMSEGDDVIVPPVHMARFRSERPTTQAIELEAGHPDDRSTGFVHGTISAAGRARYASAIGAFADRAVAARRAQRSAARTGCAQVNRSLTRGGLRDLQSALRCLARTDTRLPRSGAGRWRQTSVKVRGDVNAARIWALLRATSSGRRALVAAARRRAEVSVRTGDESRVVLRATR